jgi:hypothetical protein
MNAGEAQHRRGAKRVNRFDDAMGEAREAHTGLRMALAFELIHHEQADHVIDKVDRIVAILYKLSHPARRALRRGRAPRRPAPRAQRRTRIPVPSFRESGNGESPPSSAAR